MPGILSAAALPRDHRDGFFHAPAGEARHFDNPAHDELAAGESNGGVI